MSIRDMEPQPARGRQAASVRVSGEASWPVWARFLHALQRSPLLLQVEKMHMRVKGDLGEISTQLFITLGPSGDE